MYDPHEGVSSSDGIAKSLVGGVWKPVTSLSRTERAAHQGQVIQSGVDRVLNPVKPPSSAGRLVHRPRHPGDRTPSMKTAGTLKKFIMPATKSQISGRELGRSMPDGRGGGHVELHTMPGHNTMATMRHEMAHITPRRNIVRFGERMRDPVRSGREEGRADFVAYGKPSPGDYPGTREFQRGYNEVQNKMHAARQRRVKKSYQETPMAFDPHDGLSAEVSISKSWVPGKGWVEAGKAGAKVLREALGSHKQMIGSNPDRKFVEMNDDQNAFLRSLLRDPSVKSRPIGTRGRNITQHTIPKSAMDTTGAHAFAINRGSKSRPEGHLFVTDQTSPGIHAHESAHLKPKRSGFRMYQISQNGHRVMREEARADMAGGQYHRIPASKLPKGTQQTGYHEAARNGSKRQQQNSKAPVEFMQAKLDEGASTGDAYRRAYKQGQWSKGGTNAYRDVQDKIGRATNHPSAGKRRFYGNQYVDSGTLHTAALTAAGTGYAVHRHNQKKHATVAKSFTPWDGVTAEVSKMSPDPSSVHVMGALGGPSRTRVRGERRRRGTFTRVIGT